MEAMSTNGEVKGVIVVELRHLGRTARRPWKQDSPARKLWKHLKTRGINTGKRALQGQQNWKCALRQGHGALSGGFLFPGKIQNISGDCWSSLNYLPH